MDQQVKREMVIAMSSTRNWYQYLLTNLFAILSNNKVEKIYLFIEDDYIQELDLLKEKFDTQIVCKNINIIFDKYIKQDSPNINTRFTRCSMARLFFSKEIEDEKIIYLDVDALVVSNIDEMWQIDMKDYYVCGATDSGMMKDGVVYLKFIDSNIPYVNSGVLVMNLELIRKHGVDDKWLYLINNERFMYPDQDVINAACKGHIGNLPIEYNSSASTQLLEDVSKIKIIHYTMKKENWVRSHKYSELWYEYEDLYNKFKGGSKMI